MIKFNLHTGSYQEGFKVSFQAEGKDEQEVVKDLMGKLIEKITKIEVVHNSKDDA